MKKAAIKENGWALLEELARAKRMTAADTNFKLLKKSLIKK